MDNKALYSLSYGVFMVATKAKDKTNGCITNTCIQVASNPTRIAIAVLNTNYTCDLIKESGIFNVSLLDQKTTFKTIEHFGFHSGRDYDKFSSLSLPLDTLGIPYLDKETCAVISAKVVDSVDLTTHTLFIAEIVDAFVLSSNPPLTYADYQSHVKPKKDKPKDSRKVKAWRCKICGYVYEGEILPSDYSCPLCGHGPDDFEPIYEEEKEIVGWRCKICGYIYEGKDLPSDYSCPLCGHGPDDFEPIYKEKEKKIVGWKCSICGYVYNGEKLPEDYKCPVCTQGKEYFEPIYE